MGQGEGSAGPGDKTGWKGRGEEMEEGPAPDR